MKKWDLFNKPLKLLKRDNLEKQTSFPFFYNDICPGVSFSDLTVEEQYGWDLFCLEAAGLHQTYVELKTFL